MMTQNNKLGELLLHDGVISGPQLSHALHVQKGQAKKERLGAILIGLNYLTRPRLRDAIRDYGKRELFGELLVRNTVITREELEKALDDQKAKGGALGAALLDMGALNEDELADALAEQLDVPYMVPQAHLVDKKAFNRVPEHFILANYSIPVSEIRGVVTVLVPDPANLGLKHKLEAMLRCEVQLAVGSKSRIKGVIEALLLRKSVGGQAPPAQVGTESLDASDRKFVIQSKDMRFQQEGAVLDYLVWDALRKKASDIHIEPRRNSIAVRYRIDGVMRGEADLLQGAARSLFTKAKILANMDVSVVARHQEGRILAEVDQEEVDLRLAMFRSVLGDSMVIRLFPKKVVLLNLENLGMFPTMIEAYRRLIERQCGLTLFVGSKGTGKTTSLYTALQHLNDGTRKIVTLESPAAFALDGVVQNDVSAHPDVDVRATISSLLEHDPDIIALGDITSQAAAESLLRCATMGHKVFSTLTAEDTAAALVQLGHADGAASHLCSCSIVILAQRLVRKVCEYCVEDYVPSADILRGFGIQDLDADEIEFRRGAGCTECMGTGFRGRTGIFELLVVEQDVAGLFHRKPSAHEIRSVMRKDDSFLSLEQAGFIKATQGVTTVEEVRRVFPAHYQHASDDLPRTLEKAYRVAGAKLVRTPWRKDHDLAEIEPQEEG